MEENETIELTPEDLENIQKIIDADNEKKMKRKTDVFTQDEIEWVRRFGRYYDFLDLDQKAFIYFCLSEIHENTTEREWKTRLDKNVESLIEVLKILCPDSFDYEVKTLDEEPGIKTIIVNLKQGTIFHKFIKTFH